MACFCCDLDGGKEDALTDENATICDTPSRSQENYEQTCACPRFLLSCPAATPPRRHSPFFRAPSRLDEA